MIQSLDPVGSGLRLDPLFLQGRGPVVDAEQARLLGLRNGQVVQAVIDDSATAFAVMWPAGQRQGLPTALQAFPLPSQWRWAAGSTQDMLAVLMPGGHIMLRPLKPPAAGVAGAPQGRTGGAVDTGGASPTGAAPAAVQARAAAQAFPAGGDAVALSGRAASLAGATISTPGLPAGYTLGQAFALAQAQMGQGPGAGSSAEVARLLQQAPAWAGLLRLLNALSSDVPGRAGESAAGREDTASPPLSSRLADMLGAPLPRLRGLTPQALQQAVARSGLGTEAALMAGSLGLDQDLKVALRRLLRSLPASTAAGEGSLGGLARGVDTLERSALDSLSAQMQGQLLLSLVIPFGDAGPVALRIARERARPDEEPPPFVVDVHSAHSGLGSLWLRTQVAHDQQVSLTMWAERAAVVDEARLRSHDLRQSLLQGGLKLSSLEIVQGAPPSADGVFPDPGPVR